MSEGTQLQKQTRLCKLQQAEDRRIERERLKEAREKEKAAKVAQKDAQKAARNARKAMKLSQKAKGKASQSSAQKQKRQKRVVVVPSHVQAEEAALAALTGIPKNS